MRQLFCGAFAPVTFEYAFIRAPFIELLDAYSLWTKRNHPDSSVLPINSSFSEALGRLEPLTAPPSKFLLVRVDADWTAVLSNGLGGDAFSEAAFWSLRLHVDAVAVTCMPDKEDLDIVGARSKHRAVQVQVYLGDSPEEPRRTISSTRDGNRWVFINEGPPFQFENTSRYSATAVRDRFLPEDITLFCRYFGLPTTEDGFTGPSALILTNRSGAVRSLSYEDARTALRITL